MLTKDSNVKPIIKTVNMLTFLGNLEEFEIKVPNFPLPKSRDIIIQEISEPAFLQKCHDKMTGLEFIGAAYGIPKNLVSQSSVKEVFSALTKGAIGHKVSVTSIEINSSINRYLDYCLKGSMGSLEGGQIKKGG